MNFETKLQLQVTNLVLQFLGPKVSTDSNYFGLNDSKTFFLWIMFAQKPSNGGKFQTKAITTVRAGLGGQGNCNTWHF